MYLFNLTLKTVTDLEYTDENALKLEILGRINSFFGSDSNDTTPYIVENAIQLNFVGGYSPERVRRRYRSLANNTDGQLFVEQSGIIAKEAEVGIELRIAGNMYEKSLEGVLGFIKKLNEGRIRLGDNTTLGKGLCICQSLDTISLRFVRRLHDLHYNFESQNECDCITISAHCDDGLFIDDRNNTNGSWHRSLNMIPASTWKGIFRNASNDWAEYMGEGTDIIDKMFGNRSLGIKGCLIFYDSVISDPKTIHGVRTHIDKFSASTINDRGRVRIKDYIAGAFTIRIECTEDMEPYKKYIYTVLRDLHAGRINVGAEKGIGKGFIKIDRVKEWNNVKKPAR